MTGAFAGASLVLIAGIVALLLCLRRKDAKSGKVEAIHEATEKEKDALAVAVAVSDCVDGEPDIDGLREKLNRRPK